MNIKNQKNEKIKIHWAKFNNRKGADWISDSKDVKNPYYGKEMSNCGKLENVINEK